jgi:hypothetical protein
MLANAARGSVPAASGAFDTPCAWRFCKKCRDEGRPTFSPRRLRRGSNKGPISESALTRGFTPHQSATAKGKEMAQTHAPLPSLAKSETGAVRAPEKVYEISARQGTQEVGRHLHYQELRCRFRRGCRPPQILGSLAPIALPVLLEERFLSHTEDVSRIFRNTTGLTIFTAPTCCMIRRSGSPVTIKPHPLTAA